MTAARVPATKVFALVVYIIVILVATPQAQQSVSFSGSPGAITAGPAATVTDATNIDLLVGRSTILNVGAAIARVSLTVPDVADAMVTTPQQLLIHGKAPGTISMFVWDKAGGIKTYEVVVRRDLSHLLEQVKQLFPGEPITVTSSGKEVVLAGTVSTKYVVDKAADVAAGYVDKKEEVVNLLRQQEGVASNQIMLRVRFAEVSRSAMQELGVNFFTGPNGFHDYIAQTSTQQFPTVTYNELTRSSIQGPDHWGGGRDTVDATGGKYTFSDMLNIMLFNNRYSIGSMIRALQSKGLFQSLAEPNLVTTNGVEASFLAGGEYPYPIAQPSAGGGTSVTVQFKEFGIRLRFTPTVLGNGLINLKVHPEVSSLDFTNAIVLDGFRLPALSTRKTDTEVELQDGQTFAIAGLMNNTLNSSMQKMPGIGDIPILGYLFRSRAYQKNQTELVVMITPTIVRRNSTGVSEGLPSLVQPYLGKPEMSIPNPAPYTGSPRYPTPGAPGATPNKGGDQPAPNSVEGPAPVATAPARPAPSRVEPVQQPMQTAAPVSATPAPSQAEGQQPAQRALSKEEQRRIERARAEEKKQAEALAKLKAEQDHAAAVEKAEKDRQADEAKAEADRQAAEQQRLADIAAAREKAEADKKAEAEKARQQKLDQERAKREAEVAKKNAELAKKKQDEQKKHDKALADAAARLKAAQAEYQAQLEKAKSNDKGSIK